MQYSLNQFIAKRSESIPALISEAFVADFDLVMVATAPVRIDWAGGWSDTPPICYASKGSVGFYVMVATALTVIVGIVRI